MRLSLAPERLGGVCLFNLCAAGETTLFKELPELVKMLLELGHFVAIVTNATLTIPLRRILDEAANYKERLFIKCSLQYLEMMRLGIIDTFFDNIDMIKNSGTSFSVELTANDKTIPFIFEIKKICLERLGALCHIVESRFQADPADPRLTYLPLKEHCSAWESFDSPLFNYQQEGWGINIDSFCYAGEYRFSLNMCSGYTSQCDRFGPLVNVLEEKPQFSAVGRNCIQSHCFIRYVHSVLCNAFGEFETNPNMPTYADIRDRVCTDGSHWLTPTIRKAFSRRLSEFCKPYSEDKKYYIDLLMRKVHRSVDPTAKETEKLAEILRRYIHGSVAIIGNKELGVWLSTIFFEAKISVRFTIDTSCESDPNPQTFENRLKRKTKYWYKYLRGDKPVSLNVFDFHPKVNMFIATDYSNIGRYVKLFGCNNSKLKSILELVD
jgi:hypothetical protein